MATTWRKNRTFLLEHHLYAAVLWQQSGFKEVTNREISTHLGHKYPTVAQYALAGKSILTINRAADIARYLGIERHEMAMLVTGLHTSLRRAHKNLTVLYKFPKEPPTQTERLLRAYQIEDNMGGQPWSTVLDPEKVMSDDVWRARAKLGWSRWDVAKKLKLSEGTIVHHERVNVPHSRGDDYIRLYGDALI